jgi:hypothetical protein
MPSLRNLQIPRLCAAHAMRFSRILQETQRGVFYEERSCQVHASHVVPY